MTRSLKLAPIWLALLLPATSVAEIPWTMARATVKVRPDHPFEPRQKYYVMAGRNEFASIQVVLNLKDISSGGQSFCVEPDDLEHENSSSRIPASQVYVHRAAPIELSDESNEEGATGIFFDPLIPQGTWDMAALTSTGAPAVRPASQLPAFSRVDRSSLVNAIGVFWVEIFVPEGQEGGVYKADLVFKPNGCSSAEVEWATVPIVVFVAPFDVPSTSRLTSSIEWTPDQACLAHFHRHCDHGEIPQVSEVYARFLLDHRLSLYLAYAPYHKTASGQSDFEADWDDYLQAYAPLIEEGTDPAFSGARRLHNARVTSLRYPHTGYEGFDVAALQAWWSAFEQAGYNSAHDLAFVKVGDEPITNPNGTPLAQIRMNADLVKSVSPDFRTMVTATIKTILQEQDAQGNSISMINDDLLDILTPNVVMLDSPSGIYQGDPRAHYESDFLSGGDRREVWTYQACDSHGCAGDSGKGFPNLMVDVAVGLQNRAEPWMNFLYGRRSDCDHIFETESVDGVPGKGLSTRPCFSGLHYYEIAGWGGTDSSNWAGFIRTENAAGSLGSPYLGASNDRTDIFVKTGNGDGLLVYPGTQEHLDLNAEFEFPVPSHRLKLLREGMEDFEWLIECAKRDEVRAVSIAEALFPGKPADGHMHNVVNGGTEAIRGKDLADARKRIYMCIFGLADNPDQFPVVDPTGAVDGLGG